LHLTRLSKEIILTVVGFAGGAELYKSDTDSYIFYTLADDSTMVTPEGGVLLVTHNMLTGMQKHCFTWTSGEKMKVSGMQ
jgi:hypothetical protein